MGSMTSNLHFVLKPAPQTQLQGRERVTLTWLVTSEHQATRKREGYTDLANNIRVSGYKEGRGLH